MDLNHETSEEHAYIETTLTEMETLKADVVLATNELKSTLETIERVFKNIHSTNEQTRKSRRMKENKKKVLKLKEKRHEAAALLVLNSLGVVLENLSSCDIITDDVIHVEGLDDIDVRTL